MQGSGQASSRGQRFSQLRQQLHAYLQWETVHGSLLPLELKHFSINVSLPMVSGLLFQRRSPCLDMLFCFEASWSILLALRRTLES